MKFAVAIVCAALSWSLAACTFGPTVTDGGTASATPRTLGEQCDDVDSAYCQQGTRCNIAVALAECIGNLRPLCCSGTGCTTTSTHSESTVSSCTQMIEILDCGVISTTQTFPHDCLTSS